MGLFSGQIYGYRMFDLGHEVDLQKAQNQLNQLGQSDRFQFSRTVKSVVMEEVPLTFSLEDIQIEYQDQVFEGRLVGKLWSFGALSICARIQVDKALSETELLEFVGFLNREELLDRLADEKARFLIRALGDALVAPELWSRSEEYIIFVEHHTDEHGVKLRVKELLDGEFLYKLLAFETKETLSDQMKNPIKENTLQYGTSDLVSVDWDSSFVISKDDAQDICDVIEFANVQLLELRFFDDLLDKKINRLFKEVMNASPTIFNESYKRLNREASRLYLETLEVVERVENSLKVVGDLYYARVYRTALSRLKINEWRASIDRKLETVLDICEMNKSEIEAKRSMILEIIIIVLIAIEVVPFVYGLVGKYLN